MKTFLTGSTGKLGSNLLKIFPSAVAPTHKELDITDKNSVIGFIEELKPDLVIHTAALTGIRECQNNKELAWKTNVIGTKNLVDACLMSCPKVYFVYVSTACVFDGERGMYNEEDIPDPKNYYSFTKLIGEFPPQQLETHLIARTNFVANEKWPYPKAFTDRYGTYLFANDVAKALKEVIDHRLTGTVHITGQEKMTMFQLAKRISENVEPMTINDYTGPPLTIDMSLDTIRWKRYKISEA